MGRREAKRFSTYGILCSAMEACFTSTALALLYTTFCRFYHSPSSSSFITYWNKYTENFKIYYKNEIEF